GVEARAVLRLRGPAGASKRNPHRKPPALPPRPGLMTDRGFPLPLLLPRATMPPPGAARPPRPSRGDQSLARGESEEWGAEPMPSTEAAFVAKVREQIAFLRNSAYR